MSQASPAVSIGLPVYNGEQYLEQTLLSLLAQDFRDFELIISDNASTDGTSEICREYAQRDQRIRYYRNPTNLGAAPNYNRVFELARGRYFKWAPHDDLYAPTYLRQCVEALEAAPETVVLCYPRTLLIDESGQPCGEFEEGEPVRGASPQERLMCLLSNPKPWCHPVVGLIRSDVLRSTGLIGGYAGADQTLLAELALRGEFMELPESLFLRRTVQGASPSLHATPTPEARAAWFNARHRGSCWVLPRARLLREHVRAVQRAPISGRERRACRKVLREAPFGEYWSRRMRYEELRSTLLRVVWEKYSLAVLRQGRLAYLPHRLWAGMSGLKHRDSRRLMLALSPPSARTHLALLQFVAGCLSRRDDAASRELLAEWQVRGSELQRMAAAVVEAQASVGT